MRGCQRYRRIAWGGVWTAGEQVRVEDGVGVACDRIESLARGRAAGNPVT